jgi:HEAT repeat protein
MVDILNYISDLNSENEKKRAFAAEDIAYDGLNEGIVPLVERLQIEKSRFVKEAIVNSLKKMNGTDLMDNVIPLLRSDDAFLRNAGIDILSVQGENVIEPIRKLIDDQDKDVRKFAMDVVMQLKNGHGADLIAQALDDTDLNIIITAVEYLGRLESYTHASQVNELLKNTSSLLLRCTCLETLAVIGNEESVAAVAGVYPIWQLISPLETYSYLKFIAYLGTQADLPLIIELMRGKGQMMHKEIINALQGILRRSNLEKLEKELLSGLTAYLETDINDINKYELLVLLGAYKNEEIYPLLIKYAGADNLLICQGAVEGLGLYGQIQAQSLLSELKLKVTDDELLEAIDRSLIQLHR